MTKAEAATQLIVLGDQVREETNAGRDPKPTTARGLNEAAYMWDHIYSSRRNLPQQRSGADR